MGQLADLQTVNEGKSNHFRLENQGTLKQTENEHKQNMKSSQFLYTLTFFAAAGGFLFGYDTGVVSGAMLIIKDVYQLDTFWQECIVSVTILTAIVGAIIGGLLNDSIGRRPMMMISAAYFTGGSVVMAGALNKEFLMAGRMIVGIGVGT